MGVAMFGDAGGAASGRRAADRCVGVEIEGDEGATDRGASPGRVAGGADTTGTAAVDAPVGGGADAVAFALSVELLAPGGLTLAEPTPGGKGSAAAGVLSTAATTGG